ncbi:MAG: SsrA-binding protein SmpB [Candidatus Wolfebacteria bacterium]|nr:SsrA-binding protein SmpB [Candidatus Wolfebacteria bacterium]
MSIAENKRAYFDYSILETYEAGIELLGFEVKAIKSGRMNLGGSFVVLRGGEAWLLNADIPPYQPLNTPEDYDSKRTRKLLLKKSELEGLIGRTKEKGLTLIPLKAYTKNHRIKLEIGLARSKKAPDKRESIKKREALREIRRNVG